VIRVKNVRVVPNGVDVPASPVGIRASRPTVVFTGILSYQPNVDAVLHFANELWPSVRAQVPDAVFQIVGRSPLPEVLELRRHAGIEVHADVPSVQPFLIAAWIAVAPMRSGAGLKNKILEAWAAGTPTAMTAIAANGLSEAPAQLLQIADGDGLARMVAELLKDDVRREHLGALARDTAVNLFSWRRHAASLDSLLEQLAR
jgi:glycosyltransferase involved in cell wall biosynthesis